MRDKPIIGISANYSGDDEIGTKTGLGLKGQEWQLVADDYIKSITWAGGVPIILPVMEGEDELEQVLKLCDGVLLSGGSDIDPQLYSEYPKYGLGPLEPKRDLYDLKLAKHILFEKDMPILGICRGSQVLNVATGGTIYQDIRNEKKDAINHTLDQAPKYHPSHPVEIQRDSKLYAIFKEDAIMVNSFNHQAIKKLGDGFKVTMHAPDNLIEGIEYEGDRFVVAVQWHPEMMVEHDRYYLSLFEAFVQACRRGDD